MSRTMSTSPRSVADGLRPAAAAASRERSRQRSSYTNIFAVLGPPAGARARVHDADAAAGAAVIVISDAMWRDDSAATQTIRRDRRVSVNGTPSHDRRRAAARIFVLPTDLRAGRLAGRLLLPLTLDRAAPRIRRGGHYLTGIGRLAAGRTPRERPRPRWTTIVARLIRAVSRGAQPGELRHRRPDLREELLGDTPAGALDAGRCGGARPAAGVRQRREPDDGARRGTAPGAVGAVCARRVALPDGAAAGDRGAASSDCSPPALGLLLAHWLIQVVLAVGPGRPAASGRRSLEHARACVRRGAGARHDVAVRSGAGVAAVACRRG